MDLVKGLIGYIIKKVANKIKKKEVQNQPIINTTIIINPIVIISK